MTNSLVARMTGVAAVTAGLAICAASYVESTLPIGCVDEQCAYRPQRPGSATADGFYALALVALVVAALGLGVLVLRLGRLGRTGVVAVGMIAIGAVVAVVANVVQALLFDGDMAAMPGILLPAVAAVVVGLALLMWVVIRARVVPLWAGVVVGLTVLLVPFGNLENTTVLLDIPFGLALTLAGALLVRDAGASTRVRNPGASALV